MKQSLAIFFVVFFIADFAAGQQKFEPTVDYRREAIAKGQVKEFLSAMEAMALEAETRQNWDRASRAYSEASIAAGTIGQLQKSVSHATKAIEMGQRAKDPWLEASAILFLASAYQRLGQFEKEREWLQKGVEVVKQIPSGGAKEITEARLYRQLGQNFLRQGEAQKAVEYISYSVRALEARLTFYKSRRPGPSSAMVSFIPVIQGTQGQIVTSLNQLGIAYLRAGNPQQGIKVLEQGIAVFKASGLKGSDEGSLSLGLGRAYLAQKDFPRALENLTKALQMAEERRQTSLIQQASSNIGDVFLQTQREAEAIPYFKKAIDSIESTRSLLESEEFRTSFFEDKGQIYGGIILAHLGAKNLEEAFNYNERARSRAFLDILGSKVQLAKQGSLIEEERALQAKISTLKAQLANQRGEEAGDGSGRDKLRQELEAVQKAYTDFLAKVRKSDKEQASLMNVEPLTLKQLQELLDPGVTVLEYFVPRGRAMLWVVEKDRVSFVRLSLNRSELISKVTALRESIYQAGEKDKFKQASEELYKALVEPALPHIRGKELLIIPHDVLHYIPYQALLSPQGKYLIQDYPIYYLSSASLMQFTREKRKSTQERALVMGNPSLGDPAYNLRFAEREAREVARVYPKSDVYLRAEATKPKAISLSPNYDILHFAVHGELRQDDPLNSGLLLAEDGKEDGRLRVGEIFSLNLKADTVVLSACESGLGKITSGDEIIGLTRSFIYAGTPSIITTLWKVNDRTSYELVREFYSNLRTMRKSEALRQAQLKTMEEFPHPFFWAAYGLTGEP